MLGPEFAIFATDMATVKRNLKLSPEIMEREKVELVRRHRQVVLLNDREQAALDAYCRKFRIKSKTAAMRSIVMEKILFELEDNHPTLF